MAIICFTDVFYSLFLDFLSLAADKRTMINATAVKVCGIGADA